MLQNPTLKLPNAAQSKLTTAPNNYSKSLDPAPEDFGNLQDTNFKPEVED